MEKGRPNRAALHVLYLDTALQPPDRRRAGPTPSCPYARASRFPIFPAYFFIAFRVSTTSFACFAIIP